MKKEGLTRRAYAEHAGVAVSYVQKMIKRGVVKMLPDGSIDPAVADAGRAKSTRVGKGQRKFNRAQARRGNPAKALAGVPICEACDQPFNTQEARRNADNPAPKRFCDAYCALDHAEGYTPEQIRRRAEKENWTTCKGHRARRGGDPPGVLELLESGELKESQLDGITEPELIALVRQIRSKRKQ
jgi:hypothetical protein